MGHYSQLRVDRLYFSWKSDIPAFLTFLFDSDDFFQVRDAEEPDYPSEIGFRTSAHNAVAALDRNGYTLDFFAGVYEYFLTELTEQFEQSAKEWFSSVGDHALDEPEIERRFQDYLSSHPALSPRQQLDDFLKLLVVLLAPDLKTAPSPKPIHIRLSDGKVYDVDPGKFPLVENYEEVRLLDLENLHMYMFDKPLYFPPWVSKVSMLFEDSYSYEYPEVVTLMLVRLALESVSKDSNVTLELGDIIDFKQGAQAQEEQVRSLHTELAYALVRKVNLYNHAFQNLFRNEKQIREQYIKAECRDLLSRCEVSTSAAERGRLFEKLTELVFTANRYFDLVDKRVSTGDEEIDLVVKNNVDSPFWNALQSPLFFIECKNWSTSVGAKELRDFEGKLRNHARLVKVGFFVSMNGFTREVANELKRGSREEQHVVLIERADLTEYVASPLEFFAWLERKTVKFY